MPHQLHNIIEHADLRIPLPDGTVLSARVWMPEDSDRQPVPAILEYLPYRKSDGTAARDQIMHPYFAERGYVCLRVDARGCGDSEGLFDDEYSEQELQDGVAIIEWIAAQPWCIGKVGMQGISWGGFNGLQIAARQPEALKAIITIGSTVDRYADDIHYKGGLQLTENIGWAATAMSWFSMPPDPAIVGDRWREMWLHRLQHTPFLASTWLRHPNRDGYWQHGSVCEDYSSIKAAVLTIGGLHDGYRNTMAHLLENLDAPVKGIAGPWNHKYPHISTIAPAIGYLQEAMRWWDHWLKGKDTGVQDDPAYRAYVMDSTTPSQTMSERSGRWVAEQYWPSENIQATPFYLGDGTLGVAQPFQATIDETLACGQNCGEYFPFGFGPGELPDDQNHDDALSLCFESIVQPEAVELLGAPQLMLRLSSDQPRAQIIARLCDVRPNGSSMLIGLGMLNLRHRNSFEHPEDLVPDQFYDIELTLDQCAYRLPAGHRLRLALSSSYWPYSWPEAAAFSLEVNAGCLTLPTRIDADGQAWEFEPAYLPEARKSHALTPVVESKERTIDGLMDTLRIYGDDGKHEDLQSGIITSSELEELWSIDHSDPASAKAQITWQRSFGREEWQVHTKLLSELQGDDKHWFVRQVLQAWENDELVFEQEFEDTVPRH